MPKLIKTPKFSFLAGEVSPLIASEVESESYARGMSKCENYIVDINDGIKNAPGLQYVNDAYNTAEKSRFIPFQFNEEQAYVLEFGDEKMRIITDGGLVQSGGSPVEVVTPYPIADVAALNYTQSADTLYLFHPDYSPRKVTRTSDTAWTFTEGATILNGPYKVREIGDEDITINVQPQVLPVWTITASAAIFGEVGVKEAIRLGFPVPGDPAALYWRWFIVESKSSSTVLLATLQGDALLAYQEVVNPDFKNGIASWDSLSDSGSYLGYNATNHTALLTDGAGGDAKMEQAVVTRPNVRHVLKINVSSLLGSSPQVNVYVGTTSDSDDLLTSTPIGVPGIRFFEVLPTASTIYITISTGLSTDGDTAEISEVLFYDAGDDAVFTQRHNTNEWGLAAWNSTHGFPQYGLINNQRLLAASTPTEPQTVWASELANYEGFSETTPSRPSDSFSFFPSTEQINGIRWMIEKDGIKIGTASAVWRVFAPSGGVIAPLDIAVEIDEAEGSLELTPIVAHNAIIMTPRGNSPVLEMISSLEAKGFATRDIASRAAHLFKDRRIVRWAFAKDPDSVIWCVLDNGQLLGMTYHRRRNVWAWFTRTCSLGQGYADVAVIPNSSDDNTDDVYFLVDRGTTLTPKYYIEQLNRRITPQTAAYGLSASNTPYDYKSLDSALTLSDYQAKAITSMTQADPVVISSVAHGFINGDDVRFQNMTGQRGSSLNGQTWEISDKTADTYQIKDQFGDYYGLPSTPPPGLTNSTGEARKVVTVLTGLDHLEGETVTALADGTAQENLTVTSGSITLSRASSFVHAGVPYICTAEGLDIEQSNTQGIRKSIASVDLYFVESRNCRVYASTDPTNIKTVEFEDEAYGEDPPPLFDGIKSVDLKSDSVKQVRLGLIQDKPYPIHIRRAIIHVDYAG